ncbi:MAG: hypothetical protein M3Q97_02690 [Bacteroidota bacterium]|nr:hypothetical protein [Bacteroidota bacterium]
MDWITQLEQDLAEKAVKIFSPAVLNEAEFREYLVSQAGIPDWHAEFMEGTYLLYLQKINITGAEMTKKVNAR